MKKIAVVIPKYGLTGGAEQFALEVTERLAKNPSYDIHVLANKWFARSKRITFHKVPIISFPKFLTTVSFAYFASCLIAKEHFDLVHTHDRIFKADIFSMHGIPHQLWVNEIRKKRLGLFDRATAWVEAKLIFSGSCHRYLAVSQLACQKFLQEYNIAAKDVTVIPPGVEIKRFNRYGQEKLREAMRKKLGLCENDKVVLFVSMNFELKGLDLLLEVFASLKRGGHNDIKLLVVGKGNIRKYKKAAQGLGIEHNVLFTGVWEKNIEQVYFASDILAMFSKFDTFGMTILEAMAAALPVLVSSSVGAKDLVINGKNGYVFSSTNASEIAKKIISILDPLNFNTMAKYAEKTAQSRTWENVAEEVADLYAEYFSSRPAKDRV